MRALSLFSGIGGIDLACEWAGIETVAFCEYADFPRKILKKHWPDVPIFKDVRKLTKDLLKLEGVIGDGRTIELVHGGFPCQPYSQAGKQRGKDDDRDLWPEMFRIIQELKPNWVVGENVANFANMELDRTLANLESEGYTVRTFVLPACGVDAKHQRIRTFIVANANSQRCIHGQIEKYAAEGRQQTFSDATSSCKTVANTASFGQSGQRESFERFNSKKNKKRETVESINGCESSKWEPEPELGRVANGIPNRVDRIKGLGNAVVPQQVYPIFKAIVEIEK